MDGYHEKHHIIPKCMGGDDEHTNLVLLSARAHYLAHYLLHRAYPEDRKLAHAFAMMIISNPKKHNRNFNSRMYEKAREARRSALKGISRPEWVKEKLRKPKSNKENYSKPKSKEHSESISAALIGRKQETKTCPYCGKTGGVSNMTRWHFDNCKKKM